jgi:O-antigen/teichoic acid export membrane protein
MIQYLNQFNLGISHSTNAILAINKNKYWYVKKIVGTSLTMLIFLSLLIICFFIFNDLFGLNIGSKYNFSKYAFLVGIIGILGYFNSLFSNIFRVYGKLFAIALNQSLFPILMLLIIFSVKGENLLGALLVTNLIAFIISTIVFILKTPLKLKLCFIPRLFKTIQIKGWHLFVYNTSFYLIIITTRSFVSSYYTIEDFGNFTFAFNLANVVLLLLESLSFLIFPKLINRLATATNEKVNDILLLVREVYITTSHLLIHIAILIFPVLMLFFPQFKDASNAFKLIALTIVLYTNSFGYSGYLISKGKEKKLGYLSLSALILNTLCALILINCFHLKFNFVILSTMISYFVYVYLLAQQGRKELKLDISLNSVIYDIYPARIFIPFLFSTILVIYSISDSLFILPIILFVILNYKSINNIKAIATQIITNKHFINI